MTTTDIATTTRSALAVSSGQDYWTDHQLAALRQIGVDQATPGDLAVFLNYAQRTGLDPFSRQIYMIGRWDSRSRSQKWTIQASIDGLRIVAQRSGDYAGQVGPQWCGTDGQWRDVWLDTEPPAAARVGVLRRGFDAPLYAVAVFREYAATTKDGGLTSMWRDKPSLMVAKCAEALALRKAFPNDLGGVYIAEEMDRSPSRPVQRHTESGVDYAPLVDAAATLDEVRHLWSEAKAAGALSADLSDRLNARAAALIAEDAPDPDNDPDVIEDAVLVDDETGEVLS